MMIKKTRRVGSKLQSSHPTKLKSTRCLNSSRRRWRTRRSLHSALRSAQSTESCWTRCRKATLTTLSRLGWTKITTTIPTTSAARYPPSRCPSKCNRTHTWYTRRTLLLSQCVALIMANYSTRLWALIGLASFHNKWDKVVYVAHHLDSNRSRCITPMAQLDNYQPTNSSKLLHPGHYKLFNRIQSANQHSMSLAS